MVGLTAEFFGEYTNSYNTYGTIKFCWLDFSPFFVRDFRKIRCTTPIRAKGKAPILWGYVAENVLH